MLLFKDLKNGYPVYILNKLDMTLIQGVVTSVSFPHVAMNYKPGQTGTVVDVTIMADGKTATYEIPDNLSVTFANDLALSTEKAGLINEVEAIKNTAEQIISSYDSQKERHEKATTLLSELNPAFKDQKQTGERLDKMESSIAEMKGMMEKLMKSLGDK